MLSRLAFTVISLLVVPAALLVRPDGIFDLTKEKAQRAVLTVGDTVPSALVSTALSPVASSTSMMLLNLEGVLGSLSTKELSLLAATPMPNSKMLDARGDLRRICVVHLFGKDQSASKRVEILCSTDGIILAQELPPSAGATAKPGRVMKLDSERFRQASLDWPRYRGTFELAPSDSADPAASSPASKHGTGLADKAVAPPLTLSPGSVIELPNPLMPAPILLDQTLLGNRFLGGHRSTIPPADRLLSTEKMFLRLPANYDAKHPVGLLVWINAGIEGRPPAVFTKALDELGIACVGIANVGNDRPVANRYQLALDAIYAASVRLHVDPRRVYVTGISGGGRVSSMLLACFPDYFTGAVPIVGLSNYQRVPLGNSLYAPAGYEKPPAKMFALFRTRRMAVITGGADFNHPEIVSATAQLQKDNVQIRAFDYEKLGHQMPSSEQFLEAITWTDQPYQETRKKETDTANALLEKYIQKRGSAPPTDPKARAELVKVTEAGAWTDAAWKALELLRAVKQTGFPGEAPAR